MTHREFRVFSQTDDKDEISRIGEVACREFNFDRFVNVEAVSASNLRKQFSDEDFLAYITYQQPLLVIFPHLLVLFLLLAYAIYFLTRIKKNWL